MESAAAWPKESGRHRGGSGGNLCGLNLLLLMVVGVFDGGRMCTKLLLAFGVTAFCRNECCRGGNPTVPVLARGRTYVWQTGNLACT